MGKKDTTNYCFRCAHYSGHAFVCRRNKYQPKAVMPCGWGVKAGMIHVWVAG